MLTISKPLTAGQAQNYHKKEFTAKEQSYWSRDEHIPGAWQGRLAGHYGLCGAVGEEEFRRLSQGQHPLTGEQLVRHRASYQYERADGNRYQRHAPRRLGCNLFGTQIRILDCAGRR